METKIETNKISPKPVFRLSEQLAEPGWLREVRLAALERFNKTPWPTGKEEIWRKTKIRHFQGEAFPVPKDSFGVAAAEQNSQMPEILQNLIGDENDFSAILVHAENRAAWRRAQAKDGGVFLFDLPSATRFFQKELTPFFQDQEADFPAGKLELLHEAFWNTGTFLRVPENVTVKKPVLTVTHRRVEAGSVFPQTVLLAGANSSVTLIEMVTGETGQAPQARNQRVKILVSPGAKVNYFLLLLPAEGETAFTSVDVAGRRDSAVRLGIFQIGGALSKTHVRTNLAEKGASADIQGLFFLTKRQQTDIQTFQKHATRETESNLRIKGAVAGKAHAVFRGVIHIAPGAQATRAYQINNNLLLSPKAHVDSNPALEIEADDVRCTHGATVGPVNPEQLFYLQSRGLPREVAHRLIVEGFFDSQISLLPVPELQEILRREIGEKMSQSEINAKEAVHE